MRSTKIIQMCSSSLCTCLHHMVILRTRNKITDFFIILAWASPFNNDRMSSIVNLIELNIFGAYLLFNMHKRSERLCIIILFMKNKINTIFTL